MLVLDEAAGVFPDDTNSDVRYRLPIGLAPLTGAGGIPGVMVSRGQGNGLLQLRLAPIWPNLNPGEKHAPISKARFRLLMQTPSSLETGEWREAGVSTAVLVDRSVTLDAAEAAIARRLGEGGGEIVDVEVELTVAGVAPVLPWLIESNGELLRRTLSAVLGSDPVPWAKMEDAFAGLGREIFVWHPLELVAVPPPAEAALRAFANHARPFLLDNSDAGWTLRRNVPEHLAISLAIPRSDAKTFGLRWRFSEFLAAQPDTKAFLLNLTIPAPLEGALLLIANDVPLALEGVERILIEVKTGGPTGRVTHVFLPGQPSAARVAFVRETFEELNLEWRATMTVATSKGPAMVDALGGKTGLAIHVTPEKIGLRVLHFQVLASVFEYAASVQVVVGSRTLIFTAQHLEEWVVGRTPPATCRVSAALTGGALIAIGEYAIAGGFTVDPSTVGAGETAAIVFRTAADLPARAAYVAVQADGGPWRTLDFGGELILPVRRISKLQAPQIRYRTRLVPRGAKGATSPLIESGWVLANAAAIEIGA